MDILFVSPSVNHGIGTDAFVVEVATRLAARHRVRLLCQDAPADIRRRLSVHDVQSVGRPMPALVRYLSFLTLNGLMLRRETLITQRRFDVVHATGGDCLFADVMTANYCQAERLRLVRTGHIRIEGKSRPGLLDVALQHLYMRVVSRVERLVYRRPGLARVTAVSAGLKADLVRHYGCPPEKIITIPNGVDLARFPPAIKPVHRQQVRARHGFADDDFVLLFLGGDWGRKGLRHAVRAVANAESSSVHLVVAGRGDVDVYRRLARRMGAADRVTFVGHVPSLPYLHAADALVMPSAYEGFSLAMLEGAAAELPILATAVNGTAELVQDGLNGFVVEADGQAIARRIDLLACDTQRARAMGARARARVAEHFTWDSVANATECVYEQVIDERTCKRPCEHNPGSRPEVDRFDRDEDTFEARRDRPGVEIAFQRPARLLRY